MALCKKHRQMGSSVDHGICIGLRTAGLQLELNKEDLSRKQAADTGDSHDTKYHSTDALW